MSDLPSRGRQVFRLDRFGARTRFRRYKTLGRWRKGLTTFRPDNLFRSHYNAAIIRLSDCGDIDVERTSGLRVLKNQRSGPWASFRRASPGFRVEAQSPYGVLTQSRSSPSSRCCAPAARVSPEPVCLAAMHSRACSLSSASVLKWRPHASHRYWFVPGLAGVGILAPHFPDQQSAGEC
jgi:hypothetical protein